MKPAKTCRQKTQSPETGAPAKGPKSEPDVLGLEAVLAVRPQVGLSLADVAERMGTTPSALSRLENALARGHVPSLRTLQRYAHALGKRMIIRFV